MVTSQLATKLAPVLAVIATLALGSCVQSTQGPALGTNLTPRDRQLLAQEAQPVFADATGTVPTRGAKGGAPKSSAPAGPQLASVESKPVESPGFFSRWFKWGGDAPKPEEKPVASPHDKPAAARPATAVATAHPTPKPVPRRDERRDDQAAEPKVRSAAEGEGIASVPARATAEAAAAPATGTPGISSFSGSITAPPSSSITFDSRWGGLR